MDSNLKCNRKESHRRGPSVVWLLIKTANYGRAPLRLPRRSPRRRRVSTTSTAPPARAAAIANATCRQRLGPEEGQSGDEVNRRLNVDQTHVARAVLTRGCGASWSGPCYVWLRFARFPRYRISASSRSSGSSISTERLLGMRYAIYLISRPWSRSSNWLAVKNINEPVS